jgi:WD40 repeat protein
MKKKLVLLGAVLLSARIAAAQGLTETGRIARPKGVGVNRVAFSPDGKLMAAACADGKIRVWALSSGEMARVLEGGAEGIRAIAFSTDSRWLAAGSSTGNLSIFDAATGDLAQKATVATAFGSRGAPAATRGVNDLLFAPNDARLAVVLHEGPAQLWQVSPLRLQTSLTTEFAGSAALDFSADGALLATADEDTHVRVYRAADGALQAVSPELDLEPFAVGFASDGRLVAGGADKRLTLFDPRSGKILGQLPKQPDPVGALAVFPGGKRVAAAYFRADGMSQPAPLLLWDLESGKSRVLASEARIHGGQLLKDGHLRLVTITDDAFVLWTVAAD